MDWIKKHVDTVVVVGGIVASVIWMNHKFADLQKDMFALQKDIFVLEKEIAIIKTALIMQGQMPKELAVIDQTQVGK